jgi:hypothetical protein
MQLHNRQQSSAEQSSEILQEQSQSDNTLLLQIEKRQMHFAQPQQQQRHQMLKAIHQASQMQLGEEKAAVCVSHICEEKLQMHFAEEENLQKMRLQQQSCAQAPMQENAGNHSHNCHSLHVESQEEQMRD